MMVLNSLEIMSEDHQSLFENIAELSEFGTEKQLFDVLHEAKQDNNCDYNEPENKNLSIPQLHHSKKRGRRYMLPHEVDEYEEMSFRNYCTNEYSHLVHKDLDELREYNDYRNEAVENFYSEYIAIHNDHDKNEIKITVPEKTENAVPIQDKKKKTGSKKNRKNIAMANLPQKNNEEKVSPQKNEDFQNTSDSQIMFMDDSKWKPTAKKSMNENFKAYDYSEVILVDDSVDKLNLNSVNLVVPATKDIVKESDSEYFSLSESSANSVKSDGSSKKNWYHSTSKRKKGSD